VSYNKGSEVFYIRKAKCEIVNYKYSVLSFVYCKSIIGGRTGRIVYM